MKILIPNLQFESSGQDEGGWSWVFERGNGMDKGLEMFWLFMIVQHVWTCVQASSGKTGEVNRVSETVKVFVIHVQFFVIYIRFFNLKGY